MGEIMKQSSLMRYINRLGLITTALLLVLFPTAGIGDAVAHKSDSKTAGKDDQGPIVIARQGSFFVAGTEVAAPGEFDPTVRITSDEGQSFQTDHLYAQYQIPQNLRRFPLVFIHGASQTGKTWESTPDGREGYQTIFLRRGFAVYVVDFPRRARAGFPSFNRSLGLLLDQPVIPDRTNRGSDQVGFINSRLGPKFLEYFPNTQFPKTGLHQFLQQYIPSVMDDPNVVVDVLVALLVKIGPAILVSHSQSGQFAYLAAIRSPNVKAIVDYEGVNQPFPEGEVPEPLPAYDGFLIGPGAPVPLEDFLKLTKIPIQIVVGDNFPPGPQPNLLLETPRIRLSFKNQFVKTVNQHGGDASLLRLPDVGIYGNTHFPFSDLNNLEVADLMSKFLQEKGLDQRAR